MDRPPFSGKTRQAVVCHPSIYDPASPAATQKALAAAGVQPNRTMGQSFLVHGPTLDKIVAAAATGLNDAVLEIGPGLGALTARLLERSRLLVAVEKDAALAAFLQNQLPVPRLKVICADALEVEWQDLGLPETGVHLVSNLPYSISKPMIRRIMEPWRPHLATATLTVQREVARRLLAGAGDTDYGPMALMAQLHGHVSKLFDVAPSRFHPAPSVTSSVVHIAIRAEPAVHLSDERLFWSLIRAGFGQRRKQLGNTLRSVVADADQLDRLLVSCGIDGHRRAETLSLAEFAELTNQLHRARQP